jgi:hypothetical protein
MILNAILKNKIDNDFLHNENMIYFLYIWKTALTLEIIW